MDYSIARILAVFEETKAAPNISESMQQVILVLENGITEYLKWSTQKLVLAPEYSTIQIMKELGEAKLQRIRATNVEDAAPISEEDRKLVAKGGRFFEVHLSFAAMVFEAMRIIRDDYKARTYLLMENMPDLCIADAGPPQFIHTSLVTYCFRNRDIGYEHQLDESRTLHEHHEAMGKQTKLLNRQISGFQNLPIVVQLAGHGWHQEIEGLLQKSRLWEKELLWGKAALEMAEESSQFIYLEG
ncbi:MAG: hypothetical protein Q9168_003567 [Polycauliona sp. 1 TL-2023]